MHSDLFSHGEDRLFLRTRFGLCEDYPEHSHPLSHTEEDFALLADAGIRTLRVSIAWSDVEPMPGLRHWAHVDGLMHLAERYGIELLPYLCYTPAWAAEPGADPWKRPPQDPAAFGAIAGAIAARYQGRVRSWELWNEPDNADFWTGTPAQFAEMVKAGAAAIRKVDPTVQIVLGGLATRVGFLRTLLRDHDLGAWIDVVNMHNYDETWVDRPAERSAEDIQRIADLVGRFGNGQAIWVAEAGYASRRPGGAVSAWHDAHYRYEHTPEYAADHLVRTVATLLATERVETLAWYEVRELPCGNDVIGDANNHYLGLHDADARPLPAMAAFTNLARLFSRGYRCLDGQMRVARSGKSDAHVHAFEFPDGRVAVFAWLQTVTFGSRHGQEAGQARDIREETLEIALPLPGWAERVPPALQRLSLAGERRGRPCEPSHAAGELWLPLTLRGGETELLMLGSRAGSRAPREPGSPARLGPVDAPSTSLPKLK